VEAVGHEFSCSAVIVEPTQQTTSGRSTYPELVLWLNNVAPSRSALMPRRQVLFAETEHGSTLS
jgi:hypothetical protein